MANYYIPIKSRQWEYQKARGGMRGLWSRNISAYMKPTQTHAQWLTSHQTIAIKHLHCHLLYEPKQTQQESHSQAGFYGLTLVDVQTASAQNSKQS